MSISGQGVVNYVNRTQGGVFFFLGWWIGRFFGWAVPFRFFCDPWPMWPQMHRLWLDPVCPWGEAIWQRCARHRSAGLEWLSEMGEMGSMEDFPTILGWTRHVRLRSLGNTVDHRCYSIYEKQTWGSSFIFRPQQETQAILNPPVGFLSCFGGSIGWRLWDSAWMLTNWACWDWLTMDV